MTGLVEEIADRLELMNVEVVRDDRRVVYHQKLEHGIVDSEILGEAVNLHDYQVDVANLALEEKRGIIKCATGGGKTAIFTAILKAFSQKYPAIMLCRSKSIIDQTKAAFEKYGLENVGIVYMNNVKPDLITCATAQSVLKLEPLISRTRILLVDEVHEWASKEGEKILKLFDNCVYKLGFSATPFNEDQIHNLKLIGLIGPQLCDVSIEYLKEKNILSSCHAHFYRIQVPPPADGSLVGETYLQSDNNGIVENMNLHRKVVEIVQNIPKGRILILVRRLSHGDRLKELLPEAYWVRGEDNYKTREYVLSQLRHSASEKVVAIMSAIGFYGLDVLCHHLVNTCGGKDANLLIQKVGRGLRRGIDKTHLEYHDFMFHGDKFLNRHSKIRIQVLRSEGHDVTTDDTLEKDKQSFLESKNKICTEILG
ncbi:uncharacterized protein LOC126320003 [Schistocerca gregaria]|uniref:uncharacterized protein LOC126320003 n=1 Tax=Schistocerca gregaria TaxID=7010 RepID=UPI00211E0203|nr:uncharacterized protein LOC126320003 [Schistocerca gregaria]